MALLETESIDRATIGLAFAGLAAAYYLVSIVYNTYFGPLAKFPGPKWYAASRVPWMRDLMYGRDGEASVNLHEKYGPIVRIGPTNLSFAGGAQAWNDIYGFRKSSQGKMVKDPMFYGQPINKVHSLITANDANHARQRKILSHAFSDKALKDQEPMLKQWSLKLKEKLADHAKAGEAVDLLMYLNCTTFDIMGELSFSESLQMLEKSELSFYVTAIFKGIKAATIFRAIKMYNSFTNWIMEDVLLKSDKVRAKQLEHWNYSKERADRRLERTPDTPDLWTKILEKSEGPDGLTREEHHSIASLFMVAGTETTATALSGTTYHLLQHPDVMKKLCDEIRGAFSSFDDITLESLARLKYLQACLQEGLRLYPPVPTNLPRVTPKGGTVICGEFVPEGVSVGVHQLSTYHSKDHFKKPNEMHPERWLGDEEFKDDHLDAMEPFSTGPRNCLGKNLAWHEMRLLLATVLLHFDLELTPQSKNWSDQKVYTLWQKIPLICSLTPVKA